MATYYVDPVAGNNSNDGLSFANRWLTLVGKTLAAGDFIRVIADLDPIDTTLTADFTDLSNVLPLSAVPVAVISNCDAVWTGATNVTATINTTPGIYMEGTGAANFAIASGFTTGKIAYFDLGSTTDFSAYQQISFYMQGTAAIATTNFQIKLCSDAAGNTPVNTLTLPLGIQQSCMHVVTIDNGSALSSTVRSVALYTLADPGTVTIRLDHIIACKAPSDPTALTLASLVGKNIAGDTWYPILNFTATGLVLGAGLTVAMGSNGLLGYVGTTSTGTALYRQEVTQLVTNGISTASTFGQLTNSGTAASPIVFSGGWNRTDMSTQTGLTWLSGNGVGNNGFRGTDVEWLEFSRLNMVRFHAGYYFTNSSNILITEPTSNANFGYGILFDGTRGNNTVIDPILDLNTNYGLVLSSNSTATNVRANGSRQAGVSYAGNGNVITGMSAVKSEARAVDFYLYSNNIIHDLVTRAGQGAAVRNTSGKNFLFNASIAEATEVEYATAFGDGTVFSHDHDTTPGNYIMFMDGGQISSDAVNREKSSGIAWRIDVTSTNRSITYPLQLGYTGGASSVKVACVADKLVTVSARVMRSNTGITLTMVVPGGQIAGVPSDVSVSAAASASTYETITLTFTPTASGVVDVFFRAYGGTTFSAWIDKMATIIQEA